MAAPVHGPVLMSNHTLDPTTALSASLSAEGLLFASLSIALAVASSTGLAARYRSEARTVAVFGAFVLTIIATGAASAWYQVFAKDWPTVLEEQLPAIGLAAAIVAEPLIAGYVAILLTRKRPSP